jgi:hypothetical protein
MRHPTHALFQRASMIAAACVAVLATAFTGCVLWIDPHSKTFYVFLSNRVYPDDKGNVLPPYTRIGTLAAESTRGFDFSTVKAADRPSRPLKSPDLCLSAGYGALPVRGPL